MGMISIDRITLDPRLQHRPDGKQAEGYADDLTAEEYAEWLRAGDVFDPVKIIRHGMILYLYDGFTTVKAAKLAGKTKVMAEVLPGTFERARELSWRANNGHGRPRDYETKKNIIRDMLTVDPTWADASAEDFSKKTGISDRHVRRIRADLAEEAAMNPPAEASAEASEEIISANGRNSAEQAPAAEQNGAAAAGQAAPKRRVGRPSGPSTNGRRKANQPAADPAVVRDGLQNPVPDNLRDIFAEPILDRAAEAVATAARIVRGSATWNAALPVGRIASALDQARELIEAAVPFSVCPDCSGPGCRACGQKGFLTVSENLNRTEAENASVE